MFWTKVVGVTFDGRQDVIDSMTGEEALYLEAEPDNEYDDHAVAVKILETGDPIGYISKDQNSNIFKGLQSGEEYAIDDYVITGGMDGKSYGVNIHIATQSKGTNLEKLTPQIGTGTVFFDAESHTYYDETGEVMTSGSRFEEREAGETDLSYAVKAMAKSSGVHKDKIEELWNTNSELSKSFGTVVHEALEDYIKNSTEMKEIDKMKERDHSAKNWMPNTLGAIVDQYFDMYDVSNSQSEVFVRYNKCCGFIDRLVWLDDKTVEIHDYKVIKKHKTVKTAHYGTLPKYILQQSFYKAILEANGYVVDAIYLDIFDGEKWNPTVLKPVRIDLDEIR